MTRFLFWNLNRQDLHGFVRDLARQENADVVILAECPTSPAKLLEELNADSPGYADSPDCADAPDYQYAPGNCGHLLFFTRFESSLLTPLFESHRVSIRRLTLPACQSILIAAAHLPAKMNFSEESLLVETVHLAQSIDEVEVSEGHQRTISAGRFQYEPLRGGHDHSRRPARRHEPARGGPQNAPGAEAEIQVFLQSHVEPSRRQWRGGRHVLLRGRRAPLLLLEPVRPGVTAPRSAGWLRAGERAHPHFDPGFFAVAG